MNKHIKNLAILIIAALLLPSFAMAQPVFKAQKGEHVSMLKRMPKRVQHRAPAQPTEVTSGICGDNLTWEFANGTLTISGSGDMYDYNYINEIYPEWVNLSDQITNIVLNENVTSIGAWAFIYMPQLSNVTFPSTLISIGYAAFYEDNILDNVVLPEATEYIHAFAFDGTVFLNNLLSTTDEIYIGKTYYGYYGDMPANTSITIKDGTKFIAEEVFLRYDANGNLTNNDLLTSVTFPESLVSIGDMAFCACSGLTSVVIPANVQYIGENAFNKLNESVGIKTIEMKGMIPPTIYGGTFSPDIQFTIPSGADVAYNADPLWKNFMSDVAAEGSFGPNITWSLNKTTGELTISGEGEMQKVQNYVEIPWANYCSCIKSVVVEAGVTSISNNAFLNSTNLTEVSLPDGLLNIYDNAFYGCTSLATINLPASIDLVDDYAFDNTPFLNSFPEGIIRFGNTIYMYNGTFKPETEIVLEEGVKYINSYTFAYDDFENLYINEDLISVSLPSSLEVIGVGAFACCTNIKNITIPENVKLINSGAFAYCCLEKVDVLATVPPKIEYDSFNQTYAFFSVPKESLTAYTENKVWNKLLSDFIDGDVNGNISWSFDKFSNVLNIYNGGTPDGMPDYEVKKEPWAFLTKRIKSVRVDEGVSGIGKNNFNNIIALDSVFIGESVTSIADNAFSASNISAVVCYATNPPAITTNSFPKTNIDVLVPHASLEDYKATDWGQHNLKAVEGYLLTLNVNDANFGSVSESGFVPYDKTTVEIQAVAKDGYHFVKWSDENTDAVRSITVTADLTLTATFEANGSSVDVENVSLDSAGIYTEGSTLYFESADNLDEDYFIFDVNGKLVYSGRAASIQLPNGIYMLHFNNNSIKVVL